MYTETFLTREAAIAGLVAIGIKDKKCDYNIKSWKVIGSKN